MWCLASIVSVPLSPCSFVCISDVMRIAAVPASAPASSSATSSSSFSSLRADTCIMAAARGSELMCFEFSLSTVASASDADSQPHVLVTRTECAHTAGISGVVLHRQHAQPALISVAFDGTVHRWSAPALTRLPATRLSGGLRSQPAPHHVGHAGVAASPCGAALCVQRGISLQVHSTCVCTIGVLFWLACDGC